MYGGVRAGMQARENARLRGREREWREMAERMWRAAAWGAPVLFVLVLAGFGLALPGFEQARHPVALLGARGVPRADAFNLAGFVLPGVLEALFAAGLRRRCGRAGGRAARLGAQMLLIAGLAFAAQGLLPWAPQDLENAAGRLHALAWLLWWIAALLGLVLAGAGLGRGRLRVAAWVAAGVVALGLAPLGVPALTQRAAFLAWLAWAPLATAWLRRRPAQAGAP